MVNLRITALVLISLLAVLSVVALTTIDVAEGDLVRFNVTTQDLDNDTVSLKYSYPLDSNGEWQTGYEDAGEHPTQVMVLDQESNSTKDVIIRVANTNRAPEKFGHLVVNEGETAHLSTIFIDPDGDSLTYFADEFFDEDGNWDVTFFDAGEYDISIIAFDGAAEFESVVKITVNDVETPPIFVTEGSLFVRENEMLQQIFEVNDPEGDNVTLSVVAAPFGVEINNNTLRWTPNYDVVQRRTGFFAKLLNTFRLDKLITQKKPFTLELQACGKELCTNNEYFLIVENVNRAPTLDSVEVEDILENEILEVVARGSDPDGDVLRYFFGKPVSKDGTWETGYEDAGDYTIPVTVSDGSFTQTQEISFSIGAGNRPPTIDITQSEYKINEDQSLSFRVSATDEDGDDLTISLANLPPGASFSDGMFSWTPTISVVEKDVDTWLNNFVSTYPRLNRRFNKEMEGFYLDFTAFDGEFSTHSPVIVLVKNVNQGPFVSGSEPSERLDVMVNEPLLFSVAGNDGDMDELDYTWSFGPWESSIPGVTSVNRTFVEPGFKEVSVEITDGISVAEKKWVVNVLPAPSQQVYVQGEFVERVYPKPQTYVTYYIDDTTSFSNLPLVKNTKEIDEVTVVVQDQVHVPVQFSDVTFATYVIEG